MAFDFLRSLDYLIIERRVTMPISSIKNYDDDDDGDNDTLSRSKCGDCKLQRLLSIVSPGVGSDE